MCVAATEDSVCPAKSSFVESLRAETRLSILRFCMAFLREWYDLNMIPANLKDEPTNSTDVASYPVA